MSKYMEYPVPIRKIAGERVDVMVYDNEKTAKLAAVAAEHNREVMYAEFYWFGPCTPGHITERNGEFLVTTV
jgi:hypothetical protein